MIGDFFKIKSVNEDGNPSNVTSKHSMPWVEKYRPARIENIVSHVDVVSTLKKCLTTDGSEGFPNLLFYGSPGTGKTSTIIAACKQLFEELYSQRVLELNASDDRGIQVVREKIKRFAQLSASVQKLKSGNGKVCPPFKIIVLDEADAMTTFAQAALRRTMETESKTTRFCLICNYVSNIIEPILSRCMIFRFRDLPRQSVIDQLLYISSNENLKIEDSALEYLVDHTNGDLRKAINMLQSSKRMLLSSADSNNSEDSMERSLIRLNDLQESSGIIPQQLLNIMISCLKGKPIVEIQKCVKEFLKTGYSVRQLLQQVQAHLLNDDLTVHDITEERLALALEKLAISDKRLMDGASEYLQLLDLFTCLSCTNQTGVYQKS
ncbi:hypothetical protein GJ496_011439 [Pomphorhynchus laevis]|nr:hypothetical protein GJ496_011439 [Pomphorhynchus laevis]